MELRDAIEKRRSVRAFTLQKIAKEEIQAILGMALRAPSAINLQPWEFTVVMDEEKERLSRRLLKRYREKRIPCSPGNVKPLPDAFSRRGNQSFELMNPFLVSMGKEFGTFINEGSCQFYGAPAAVIICLDNAFSKARLVDIGIILGYFLLAAEDRGLATCPVGLIKAYEEDVKEVLNIDDSKEVVIGVALGYADPESPINAFKSPRDDLDRFVKWIY